MRVTKLAESCDRFLDCGKSVYIEMALFINVLGKHLGKCNINCSPRIFQVHYTNAYCCNTHRYKTNENGLSASAVKPFTEGATELQRARSSIRPVARGWLKCSIRIFKCTI